MIARRVRLASRHGRAAQGNTDRITRVFARFTAFGYLAYLVILFPPITATAPRMQPWWTPIAVIAVFGFGISIGLVSFRRDTRAIRLTAGAAAIAFLLAGFTWPLAWIGPKMQVSDQVWLAAFPGLASIAAVLAWPVAAAFGHLVVGCVTVQIISFASREGISAAMLIPEIAFAIMFCTLFVGGAAMALRTGRVLDDTTDETHRAAASAAAQRGRAVEQDRFAALIHDGVLATLLTASRGQPKTLSAGLAVATIRELDEIAIGGDAEQSFSVDGALTHLRVAAAEADPDVTFRVSADHPVDLHLVVPGTAVRTLGAALAEAVRNSRLHAGESASRTVDVVVTERVVEIRVIDDGVGFDRSSVAPHRLGVTVSILGRMRQLAGGSAEVVSAPGQGTTVTLRWDAA